MIDQFQIVLFLKDPPPSALELLNAAFPEVDPEEFRKMPNQGSFGLVKAEGFTIAIQCQINRIDITVDRPADDGDASSAFIEDEDLEAAFAIGRSALVAITDQLSVVRGAVLVTKSEIMASSEAAFADILSKVPGLPHPNGATDVDYRINVPIRSARNDQIKYNRVARWFAAKRGIVSFAANQNLPSSALNDVSILSTDVNVSVDGSVELGDVEACISEMFSLSRDLLARGVSVFQ